MAQVGYVRVSSASQNTERQLDGVNLDKVFEDKVSGATSDRPQLAQMLDYVREGDTIHIHSIDRLARSLSDLLSITNDLMRRGIKLQFHKENLSFTGDDAPMERLMLSMMGSFAEFERAMIRERQAEGIAKAKQKGIYKGRVKTIDDSVIRNEVQQGLSYRKVAAKLGISLSTVQRAMKEA